MSVQRLFAAMVACGVVLTGCFGVDKPQLSRNHDAGSDLGADTKPDTSTDAMMHPADGTADGGLSDDAMDEPSDDDGGTRDAAPDDGIVDATPENDVRATGGSGGGAGVGGSGGTTAGDASPPNCAPCTTYGTPQPLGPISATLHELSGLAASRVHPGLFYTHNDSGDSARFFAIDQTATITAELHLTGATATDWESISVGSCPTGSCVYIGDAGDNKLDRDQYVIYRVTEPSVLPSDGSAISVTYEEFPFVYPDGHHNVETLMVDPNTNQVFVITKDKTAPPVVFEMPLPLTAGQEITMRPVATLMLTPNADGTVTDGAFHPCGDRMLLRTTVYLFQLTRPAGGSFTSIFTATPVMMPLAVEPQGEAVTWALDGNSYFTSSETISSAPTPSLSVVGCSMNE